MESRLLARSCLLLMSVGLWTGCTGNSAGRKAITGTVNLDGSPVARGTINFQPVESGRTSSGAIIEAGKFTIPADKGLPVGKYRVEVYATAAAAATPDLNTPPGSAPPPPPSKQLIPPDWNESSKQTIEVKKEGPFNFAFEIATKGK